MTQDIKKILILIEDGSFSFDNRVKQQVAALTEAGWDVTVVSPKYQDDLLFVKYSPTLRCYHYPKFHARSLAGHIFEHSASAILMALLTGWAVFRRRIRVIQFCNPADLGWAIALPYRLFGVRTVYDQHDLCPEIYASRGGNVNQVIIRILKWLERSSHRFSDVTIVTNESHRKLAIQRAGAPEHKIHVVRNGPELKRFVADGAALDGKPSKYLIGYVGNMNDQDGVDLLVDAAIILCAERDDVSVVAIGDGPVRRQLLEAIKIAGLQRRIIMTGRISDVRLVNWLSISDVCVQPDPPSPLNQSSTMTKAMEYMALGKPVVAFDLHETRESCGDCAVYVEPSTARALATAISDLLNNPQHRLELGQKGQLRVKERLQWAHSKQPYLDAIKMAVS